MSFAIFYQATVAWVGDGIGAEGLTEVPGFGPGGAQSLTLFNLATIPIPGGDAPSSGNMATAATAVATDLTTQLQNAANLARIQAFATGGT